MNYFSNNNASIKIAKLNKFWMPQERIKRIWWNITFIYFQKSIYFLKICNIFFYYIYNS